jgi:hypothetical protein
MFQITTAALSAKTAYTTNLIYGTSGRSNIMA